MGCSPSGMTRYGVSIKDLNKVGVSLEEWGVMVEAAGCRGRDGQKGQEKEMARLLRWFNAKYPHEGVHIDQFKTFFPSIETGNTLAELVFRVLDRDGNGSIGFREIIKTLELVGAQHDGEKLCWAFRIFDIDNSGTILLVEMLESVQAVWKIFDGIGEEKPGDAEEVANDLFVRLSSHGDTTKVIDEKEFVCQCLQDKELGSNILKIFSLILDSWSFLYERWSSGIYFQQTKPPSGVFWDMLNNDAFSTVSFHSPAPEGHLWELVLPERDKKASATLASAVYQGYNHSTTDNFLPKKI